MAEEQPDMDTIVRPVHYQQEKKETMETIEDMGCGRDFCIGNIIKYLSRHMHKSKPLADLRKAEWYLQRLINYYEEKSDV